MSMEGILTQLISGNIGTAIIIIILYRAGVLKFLFKNNGSKGTESHFHISISRELGAINEKLKVIPEIKREVSRLADRVGEQNGRVSKLENKQ